MDIHNSSDWFTEISKQTGSAFSLKTTALLHHEDSPYQTIDIYKTQHFGNLMVLDGFVMLTARDNFIYHEMMTHPALFSHPNPRHVVIVGGGDCGTLQQVAKHSCVEKITQIEIDERVTRVAEEFFPELCTANNDSRVQFEFSDAIQWMRSAAKDSIDIIIVDSTDPIGPAEGLFTQDFYASCHAALSTQGLVVQQSESPLVHWESITQPMRSAMQAAGLVQTETLFFPVPSYPTGWWSATLGACQDIHLVRDTDARKDNLNTRYYNYAMHLSAFAMPAFLQQS